MVGWAAGAARVLDGWRVGMERAAIRSGWRRVVASPEEELGDPPHRRRRRSDLGKVMIRGSFGLRHLGKTVQLLDLLKKAYVCEK